jgi:periplasmic copper chaperone A
MRRMAIGISVVGLVAILGVVGAQAGQQAPKASSGWVKLPAAGGTSTEAYVVVENPGMYAIYLLTATSDVAGSVEIRQTGKDAALEEVTVPAYGSIDMDAKGVHLLLKDLKKPLAEGDKVSLTVVTELGIKLQVDAVVKKE